MKIGLPPRIKQAYQLYRDHGSYRLVRDMISYARWLIEIGLLARMTDQYIKWKGGIIHRGQLLFDVSGASIQRGTRYRMLRGTYEQEELRLVENYLSSDLDVVELGGGIGFISCYINKRLNIDQRHIIIEANPNILSTLEENRSLNDCSCEILHAAYAPEQDVVTFNIPSHFESGRVAVNNSTEGISVESTSLSGIIDRYCLDECAVVADIEGSERHLITEELNTLIEHCQLLIVECHFTPGERSRFLNKLEDNGFERLSTRGDVVALSRSQ